MPRILELEEQVPLSVDVALFVDREYGWHVDYFEGDHLLGGELLGEHDFSVGAMTKNLDLSIFIHL